MVRLVFRPYTQVRRSICTLESLRTSTRVSPGFVLLKHSSPSFGSQHVCSHSNLSSKESWSVDSAAEASYLNEQKSIFTFITRWGINTPSTRTHVRLLGPCFKTGWWEPFRQSLSNTRQQNNIFEYWSLYRIRKKAWLVERQLVSSKQHWRPSVPFQQFQVLLTLFSKFFSSFPHGTCSLSVSHRYLALDGIYHPLRAAIPNNSTRWKLVVR